MRDHQDGLPARRQLFSDEGRADLATGDGLSPAGAQQVAVALRQIDRLDTELAVLHREIVAFSRRQPGCRALQARLYGVGGLTSVMIWAELGDTRRFSASRQAVRHTVGNQSAVGEHRGRGARERQAEHLQELRVQERLPAREKDLPDAQAHRRFHFRPHAFERQKAERPDIRPAAVEAMRTGDIAKGSRNLEPQAVEVFKLDLGLCHLRASPPTLRVTALALAGLPCHQGTITRLLVQLCCPELQFYLTRILLTK